MSQIDYDTQQFSSQRQDGGQKDSFLMRLILRTGIVKDKKQANIVFLIIAVIFFTIAFCLTFGNPFAAETEEANINYEEYANPEAI